MSVALIVERAGPMTTIQDRGRFGAQAQGVPVSGALDPVALRLANALVGNPGGAPALEIRLLGPRLRVKGGRVRVALVGTETTAEVLSPDARALPAGQSVTLEDGDILQIGAVTDTACCTLAVAGTFDLPRHLGSLSTYEPSRLGGIEGRALADGDILPLKGETAPDGPDLGLVQPLADRGDQPVRIVPGPQADYFTEAAFETLFTEEYTVSRTSNRMGLRLEGPTLTHAKGYNIASDGIVNGSIQVPGSGQPIILLADRQTTGGYPKIATVISADLPRLGRALPGTRLRFRAVSVDEANAARSEQERDIRAAIDSLRPLALSSHALTERLLSKNLISGVLRADRRR